MNFVVCKPTLVMAVAVGLLFNGRSTQALAQNFPPPPPIQNSDQKEQKSESKTTENSSLIQPPKKDQAFAESQKDEKHTIEIPKNWTRIAQAQEIWLDTKNKQVIVAGNVCLNRGQLEMFICPRNTKEHESVISVNAFAHQVHGALLALDKPPGKPTSWDPKYQPASGPSIDVTLQWRDPETGKTKKMAGKKWIRNVKTGEPMKQTWVFGGSQIWKDPASGHDVYYGDGGELICLSNFSTATIDLNVQSSQANEGLLFEAFTENIPPVGTKVYAIIKPGKVIKSVSDPGKQLAKPKTHGSAKKVDATPDKR